MRYPKSLMALCLLAIFAVPAMAQVSPEALAKLQARAKDHPSDEGALRALGIALFKTKHYSEAETALQQARKLSPKDGVVALYLGMSAEERGDLPAARSAYETYLANGRTKSAKNIVNQRLSALAQKELAAESKAAVAQEQRLSSTPSDPKTIAVLALGYSGDPNYQPLSRGLADLMITDFAKVPDLKLLERDRVQAMLDEIALGRTAAADQTTAVRSGHLLQAGRVVNGSLSVTSPQSAQLNANFVTVSTSQSSNGGSKTDALANIFQSEKDVVVQTIKSMGIVLTPEQTRAINGNIPTRNIQAFLAYSRGLVSSDAGRLDEAANFFDNARSLDPSFSAAASHAGEARAGAAGQTVTTAKIETTLKGSAEGQTVSAAEHGNTSSGRSDAIGTTIQNTLADVNPSTADAIGKATSTASTRDASSSTTSTDQTTTKTGTLTIVIKRP